MANLTPKKKKPIVSSRKVEFELGDRVPIDLANSPEGKDFGLFPVLGGNRATIGRSLDYGEYEGTSLPEWRETRQLLSESRIEFDVRVTCDQEGITYLEIHQKNHQTFYSFPFKGIECRDAILAAAHFANGLSRYLVHFGIYPLFLGFYRRKESNREDRKTACDNIIKKFKTYFRDLLKLNREREIEIIEKDGLRISTYEKIASGREPKSDAELEQQKAKFIRDVFEAFRELDRQSLKRTQYGVGMAIFDGERNPARKEIEKAIGNRLRNFGLSWKELLADYAAKNP